MIDVSKEKKSFVVIYYILKYYILKKIWLLYKFMTCLKINSRLSRNYKESVSLLPLDCTMKFVIVH